METIHLLMFEGYFGSMFSGYATGTLAETSGWGAVFALLSVCAIFSGVASAAFYYFVERKAKPVIKYSNLQDQEANELSVELKEDS
jgi:sugar phosphate permease